MRLKQLEIAGFKSFAKHTTLEFPTSVVAIVGPNGSGKSNVSEAIRWVLGEQSMKSLRGKRGEDLIFHGSNSAAQLGKASVKLTFDNADHVLPVDFDEVTISREVYRDGSNEYRVNGSIVRLKDIIEILSKVGIGGSGHHIISQGEADRILYANPKERKHMIEDALGLKIYEIKRLEAERKLEATAQNMKQVEALRREIQPHLRFLKTQVDKVEASARFRSELQELLREFLSKEKGGLMRDQEKLKALWEPLSMERSKLEEEIKALKQGSSGADEPDDSVFAEKISDFDRALTELDEKRRAVERELGRIEGQLAYLSKKQGSGSREESRVAVSEVVSGLETIVSLAESVLEGESLEDIRGRAVRLRDYAQSFHLSVTRKDRKEEEQAKAQAEELADFHEEQQKLRESLSAFDAERSTLLAKRRDAHAAYNDSQKMLRISERAIRQKEDLLNALKDKARSLEVESERIRMRTEDVGREAEEAARYFEEDAAIEAGETPFHPGEREEMRRRIERLKIRIEEVGGIDASIAREYQEIAERDAFLERELGDLSATAAELHELTSDLKKHLENDFREGVEKINAEFSKLFTAMFGGGEAELTVTEARKKKSSQPEAEDGNDNVEEEAEEGVEISVNLPRKRVKNLDMLSGGERALTSIALLFAMSSVNPPPFLVLDETDAALDEANSQRYGAMLKNLSDKTQLIVITHNRQTMKEAGVLYGVTMGADGISKLLSIKFEEAVQVAK